MAGHGVKKIAKILGQPRIIVQDVITKYKEENRTDSAPQPGPRKNNMHYNSEESFIESQKASDMELNLYFPYCRHFVFMKLIRQTQTWTPD
ncbi:3199_t:CDS:2 [Funneliformis mosseae]|uniref:3199_t:CDS:1 n=1 Tax=Funneliformis mosseae TaxID=27381 RepID=A0A9N9BEW9_FUNMO|nr:3199_t:CDS:2 [Funneliformis mosseae]